MWRGFSMLDHLYNNPLPFWGENQKRNRRVASEGKKWKREFCKLINCKDLSVLVLNFVLLLKSSRHSSYLVFILYIFITPHIHFDGARYKLKKIKENFITFSLILVYCPPVLFWSFKRFYYSYIFPFSHISIIMLVHLYYFKSKKQRNQNTRERWLCRWKRRTDEFTPATAAAAAAARTAAVTRACRWRTRKDGNECIYIVSMEMSLLSFSS